MKRGDLALDAGQYGKALAAYLRARELAPTDPSLQRAAMKARVHLVAAEPSRINPEMIDEARYEAETLLETDSPRKAVYLTALANLALRSGNTEDARNKLEEAVKVAPDSALAQAALGTLLLGKKETLSQARSAFAAALKAKPDSFAALLGLARVNIAEGDMSGGTEKLLAALKLREDFGARMSLGNIYAEQRKPEDAVFHFQTATKLEPKSADALAALGQALLSAGRPEEAELALRSALDLRADEPTVLALGFALLRRKKSDQALDVFQKVLAKNPDAATAHYGAALTEQALGHNEQAIRHYKALLSLRGGGTDQKTLAEMQKEASRNLAALEPSAATSATAAAVAPPPSDARDPFNSRR